MSCVTGTGVGASGRAATQGRARLRPRRREGGPASRHRGAAEVDIHVDAAPAVVAAGPGDASVGLSREEYHHNEPKNLGGAAALGTAVAYSRLEVEAWIVAMLHMVGRASRQPGRQCPSDSSDGVGSSSFCVVKTEEGTEGEIRGTAIQKAENVGVEIWT